MDEDGCCATCGATATGEGVDAALAALTGEAAEKARADHWVAEAGAHADAVAAKDAELAALRQRVEELEAEAETAAKAFLARTSERDGLRKVAGEAIEAARFLDGIRKRSMGTAAVANRLIGVLREAGLDP